MVISQQFQFPTKTQKVLFRTCVVLSRFQILYKIHIRHFNAEGLSRSKSDMGLSKVRFQNKCDLRKL